MSTRTEPKLIAGFVIVMIAIIANVFVSSANMDKVVSNRKWVSHSHEVQTELEATASAFQDATIGERGYVITGQDVFLEPYKTALSEIDQRLANLRRLTADNIRQRHHIDELNGLKQTLETRLAEVIRLRRTQGEGPVRAWIIARGSQSVMEAIRTHIGRMETEEARLLKDRQRESEESERKTQMTFYGATAASVALLYVTFLLVARAFAERKQIADAMQKREEWLSTTLRSIGDAVIATDAQGQVLFMNGIAEDLTGWKQAEAEGKSAGEVFHIVNEETRVKVESPVDKAIERGIVVGLANHTMLISQDGTERPIEDSGAPIRDLQGRLIGVVLVFRDVSERRQTEIEREKYVEELDQLNVRLRRAMTETHHRVKNNLQVVAALIEVQEQNADETVPRSMLVRLRQNIEALAVVHNLLTEQSKENENVNALSTKGVLERMLPLLQPTLGERRLQGEIEDLTLQTKQTTAVALIANELISNAVKHGTGDIELTLRQEAEKILLAVCDDGPGFPEGFDPLVAAHTGLELIESIARYDLQGETAYRNRPQGGACVQITFPRNPG